MTITNEEILAIQIHIADTKKEADRLELFVRIVGLTKKVGIIVATVWLIYYLLFTVLRIK